MEDTLITENENGSLRNSGLFLHESDNTTYIPLSWFSIGIGNRQHE